ncbi:MAG: hypothetical protein A3D94_00225 [Alphaproteobacteria bacterium RIFCSPHIGHO2_12_FULL_66_14]|nr:MAG: hypothetical protein A3D94_00225 [Alphaproteobacteria bacterium RIFCSPHIGHO2_12_FULL_66_14]
MRGMILALVVLVALPSLVYAQAKPGSDLWNAGELLAYAEICGVGDEAKKQYVSRAARWLESRPVRSPIASSGLVEINVESLCRRFGCAAEGGRIVQRSPPPNCAVFVPRFLALRINKPGWKPDDGLK